MTAPYFRIFRATGADGFSVDTHAKFVFEPALESDELFDALRNTYPTIRTHSERKRQAVLDFLVQEREEDLRALDRLVNGEVNTTSPVQSWNSEPSQSIQQTPATVSYDSFSPSNSTETSPIAITPNFKANSSASASTTSTNPQFHVWNATSNKPIKLHKRRCMTDQEKEEYRQRRLLGSCDSCKQKRRKCRHYEVAASQAAAKGRHGKRSKMTKSASTPASSTVSKSATHHTSTNSSPSDAATQSFDTSPSFLDTHLSFDELDMNFDTTMTGQLFNGDFSLFPESTEPDFFNTMMDQPFHNAPDQFFQDFATPFTDNFAHSANLNNQPILSDWLNAPAVEGLGGDAGSSSSSLLEQVAPLTAPLSESRRIRSLQERETVLIGIGTARNDRDIGNSRDDDRILRNRSENNAKLLLVQRDESHDQSRDSQDGLAEGVSFASPRSASSGGRSSASLSSGSSSPDLHGSVEPCPVTTRSGTSQKSQHQQGRQVQTDTEGGSASAVLPRPEPQRVPCDPLDGPANNASGVGEIGATKSTIRSFANITHSTPRPGVILERQQSSFPTLATQSRIISAIHTRPHPAAADLALSLPAFEAPNLPLGIGNELRHSGHPLSTSAGTYSVFDFTSKRTSENKRKANAQSVTKSVQRLDTATTSDDLASPVLNGPTRNPIPQTVFSKSKACITFPAVFAPSSTAQGPQEVFSNSNARDVPLAPATGALAHATALAGYMMSWYCLYVVNLTAQMQREMLVASAAIAASKADADQKPLQMLRTPTEQSSKISSMLASSTQALARLTVA